MEMGKGEGGMDWNREGLFVIWKKSVGGFSQDGFASSAAGLQNEKQDYLSLSLSLSLRRRKKCM